MKTNESNQLNLREGGKEEFEATDEFARRASEIRKQITEKYAPLLLEQRSWLRRLVTKLKRENEIRKQTQQLSSWKNLHANDQTSFLMR